MKAIIKYFYYLLIYKYCFQRFFGIIRQHNGPGDNPTVGSFLQLFRMLCIYYPTKDMVNNGNISNEERMHLLTSYSDCMRANFKDRTKEAADKRKHLQDILVDGLCFRQVDKSESGADLSKSAIDIVYDLCGLIIHIRSALIAKITNNCQVCFKSLCTEKDLLSPDFYSHSLVSVRDKGGLKYCTPDMATTFNAVERVIQQQFDSPNAYLSDSFENVIDQLAKLKLPPLGCTMHRPELVSRLIYEYVVLRYRFEAKQQKHKMLSKSKGDRLAKKKLSKICTPSNSVNPPKTKKAIRTPKNCTSPVVTVNANPTAKKVAKKSKADDSSVVNPKKPKRAKPVQK